MHTMIGRYQIERELGSGAMGVVYAARDERLGRTIALKMIRAAAASEEARARLWREARAAAAVNHPNVCQVYEIGEVEGSLYIAMELLAGEPLAARIARGTVPIGEALTVLLGVPAALEALHRRDIVHRDLKPSNVFLTEHGVKLLDFGLARPLAGGGAGGDLTVAGALVGTPRHGTRDGRTRSPARASAGAHGRGRRRGRRSGDPSRTGQAPGRSLSSGRGHG